ncbi:MAG: radical SAM protein [Bacilli bacterium]|nr:radical SAM protein [Bacilli bacterium]
MRNPSLCDGPGYRTVVFLQGCDLHCEGCHNKSTWPIDKGICIEVTELASILRKQSFNKKITISGGEPLLQKEAVLDLLKELSDFDICLYTGHEMEDIPEEMFKYLKYVKVGRFILSQRTSTTPFVGSTNQKFVRIYHEQTK